MTDIPEFPDCAALDIGHKSAVDGFFLRSRQEMSECTFSSIYIWRESYNIALSTVDGALLVRTFYPDGRQVCFPPLGAKDPVGALKATFEQISSGKSKVPPGILKRQPKKPEVYFSETGALGGAQGAQAAVETGGTAAPEPLGTKLAEAGFEVAQDRDNWDYVYHVSDLVNLAGQKYHSKKKAMNKALNGRKVEIEPLTVKIMPEVLQFQDEWCAHINCQGYPGLLEDNGAILSAIKDYEKLDLFGAVLRIAGKVEAMTVAERLSDDTAVIHFEKANPTIDGLYQVINNWFCRDMLQKYTYVNREQDIGDAGLRKAKMSYHPHHMVQKWAAKLKE